MTITDNVFPQDGDPNDAARFAQLIGQSQTLDYIETGLSVSADFTTMEATVTAGSCYLSSPSATATTDGDEIASVGYAVQLSERTISLQSGDNYLVVEAAIGTRDEATVSVYVDPTTASDESLVIGYIDATNEVVEERNRNPDATFDSLTVDDTFTLSGSIDGGVLDVDISGDADTVDGKDAEQLGSGASDGGTEVVSPATDFNFTTNLSVSDDGDGTVTIDGSHDHTGDTVTPTSVDPASENKIPIYQTRSDIPDGDEGLFRIVDENVIIHRRYE